MRSRLLAVLLAFVLLLSACGKKPSDSVEVPTGDTAALGGVNDSFGEDLGELGAYDGKFDAPTKDVSITCISGTPGCYQIDGNTIRFTAISQDSVYAISGQFLGNIVIDVGDSYKFDLEMHGFSVICDDTNPIQILSGNEVSLTAKKDFQNYIYDERAAIDQTSDTQNSAAIYSAVDLEICGKGALTIVSEYNNGIHTKDDLQVKNLTLFVACTDNALKGNDSVSLENANTTLIATTGDGIKTSNSDISSKGKQRGSITICGGTHNIYAACDGIDAAYDVVIQDATTELNIYTDKYSAYSKEVTAVNQESYFIRFHSNAHRYSVKYYNSDEDYCWVDAQYHSSVSGGRTTYYYYAYPIMTGYSKVQFFIYSADQPLSQDTEYLAYTDYLTLNTAYDTFALIQRGNQLTYEWTNYTTQIQENFGPGGPGGPGGMGEGNPDKSDHSTKGIKANNQILIESGNIAIKSYDDAIHANTDNALENGDNPLGNITIQGGNITLYSNDDGLHADGKLTVNGGYITVAYCYEGAEGAYVELNGGSVSIYARDDGINTTVTSGTGLTINNGWIYIYCSGDGIDSNSRTAYCGIIFNGGHTVVISTSGGNSAIDTEQGYTYNGGSVLAIMSSGGMTNEATHCQNFNSIATKKSISLSEGKFLTVQVDSSAVCAVKIPVNFNGLVIYLGSTEASFSSESSPSGNLDQNGVSWNAG